MNRKQRRAGGASSRHTSAFVDAFNLGLQLQQAGDLDRAEAAYRKAMALNNADPMLYNNLGVVLYTQGKMAEAAALYQKAIKLSPNLALAHNNLGVTLNASERHEEAVPAFTKAIALNPVNPEAINNLGDSLVKLGRFEEGVAALKRALALVPNYAEAHSNMGMGLWGLGELDAAIASLRKSIALQPALAMPHKNLGIVLLLKGELAEGWREYEYRWQSDTMRLRNHPRPLWNGEHPGTGAVFVWCEQGVGDELLHANMLGDFAARGINVMWETDPRLVTLVQRSYPSARVVPRLSPPSVETVAPDLVAHIPAGNIGRYFRSDLSQFPKDRRSYLIADQARAAAYRTQLNVAPGEKLVGISWLSKNVTFGKSKSTVLADWAEVLRTPGVRFVDLQYDDATKERAKERAALQSELGLNLLHIDGLDLRDDLDGLAALTAACDLVITVSNSTAHIAGALGIPVWVLIPAGMGKFWYWGLSGDSTPWYPSATVIRQRTQEDWQTSFHTVAGKLAAFVAGS